jgi:hypothetical protein
MAKEKPAEESAPEDEPVTLSKAELQKLIDENRAEAQETALKEEKEKRKQAEKEKRRRERAERGEDEEEEDPAEIAKAAELRAAEAEQRAAEAEKKALMADVSVRLRDYLTADNNLKPYLGNAPDIMLHVERALTPNATEQAITRLIESHVKAFVERSKAGRIGASQQHSVSRSKITLPDSERETRTATRQEQPAERRFVGVNWHG